MLILRPYSIAVSPVTPCEFATTVSTSSMRSCIVATMRRNNALERTVSHRGRTVLAVDCVLADARWRITVGPKGLSRQFMTSRGVKGGRVSLMAFSALNGAPMYSFDHPVRAQQDRLRNRDTHRLGNLQVHNKLEFGRLLHWQVSGFDSP